MSATLLQTEGLGAGYGDLGVLEGIEVACDAGEWVALLGVVGAGKTTLMQCIAGLVPARSGTIRLRGDRIDGEPPHVRVSRGLALVPEGRRLFRGMTVDDNLTAGAHATPSRALIEERRARVFATFPRLAERRRQIAGTLSGGEQQMCAIGRALMSAPALLLVDELSLGLAPIVVDELLDALDAIRRSGTGLIVVEQDIDAALRFAARGYVIAGGRIVLQGEAAAIRADMSFASTYMGLDPG